MRKVFQYKFLGVYIWEWVIIVLIIVIFSPHDH
jgi:hypothetical protein